MYKAIKMYQVPINKSIKTQNVTEESIVGAREAYRSLQSMAKYEVSRETRSIEIINSPHEAHETFTARHLSFLLSRDENPIESSSIRSEVEVVIQFAFKLHRESIGDMMRASSLHCSRDGEHDEVCRCTE